MSGVSEPRDRVAGVRRFGFEPVTVDRATEEQGNQTISTDHVLITDGIWPHRDSNFSVLAGRNWFFTYPILLYITPLYVRYHTYIVTPVTKCHPEKVAIHRRIPTPPVVAPPVVAPPVVDPRILVGLGFSPLAGDGWLDRWLVTRPVADGDARRLIFSSRRVSPGALTRGFAIAVNPCVMWCSQRGVEQLGSSLGS